MQTWIREREEMFTLYCLFRVISLCVLSGVLSSFLPLLATLKDLPSFLLSWETMALVHARFLLDVNEL